MAMVQGVGIVLVALLFGQPALAGERKTRVKILDGHCLSGGGCHNPHVAAVEKAVLGAGCRLSGFGKARTKRQQSQIFYRTGFRERAEELALGPLAPWVDPKGVEKWKRSGNFDLLVVVAGKDLQTIDKEKRAADPDALKDKEAARISERDGLVYLDGALIGGPGAGAQLQLAWKIPIQRDDPKYRVIFQVGMGSRYWVIVEQFGKSFADKLWIVDGHSGKLLQGMPGQRPELLDGGRIVYSLAPDPLGARLVWAQAGDRVAKEVPLTLKIAQGRAETYMPGPNLILFHQSGRSHPTLGAVSLAQNRMLWTRSVPIKWAASERHIVSYDHTQVFFVDPSTSRDLGRFSAKGIEAVYLAGDTAIVKCDRGLLGVDALSHKLLWQTAHQGEIQAYEHLVVVHDKQSALGLATRTGQVLYPKMWKPYPHACDYDPARKMFVCHYDMQVHWVEPVSGDEKWVSDHVLGEGAAGLVVEDHSREPADGAESGGAFIRLRRLPQGPTLLSIPYSFSSFFRSTKAVVPPEGGKPMHIVLYYEDVLYGFAVEVAKGQGSQVFDESLLDSQE